MPTRACCSRWPWTCCTAEASATPLLVALAADDKLQPRPCVALQAREDAQAQMVAVPRDQRWEVELLHQAG